MHWLLTGVPPSAEGLVLADIITGRRTIGTKPTTLLHITTSDRSLDRIHNALAFFAPSVEVLRFPAWDCMPYDRASPMPSVMAARMRVLASLVSITNNAPRIILTTVSAVIQKIPPRSVMRKIVFALKTGASINRDALINYLVAHGYQRNGKAMDPGEFALRGSIIDIIPAGSSDGIRVDLLGSEIESIRIYDPLSQITHAALTETILYPMSEVLLTPDSIGHFRASYRDLFGAVSKEDPLYEAITSASTYPGMEHWLPLFYDKPETLFDYCKSALVTLEHEAEAAIAERQESILDYYEARVSALKTGNKKNSFASGSVYNPVPVEQGFLTKSAWEETLQGHNHAIFSPFISPFQPPQPPSLTLPRNAGEGTSIPSPVLNGGGLGRGSELAGRGSETAENAATTINYRPAFRFTQGQTDNTPFDQLKARVNAAAAAGKPTLIACFTEGSRERMQTLLMEREFHCIVINEWKEHKSVKGKTIGLAIIPIEQGFETETLLILSEQDVLGERISRAKSKKKKSDVFLAESVNFTEGELVVHKEHGIGRFEGLITLNVSGASHDCLKIVYADDDKLFLPVENIDMVSRFGLEEEGVKLDKLGGASWQARKAKLKDRIKIAAVALLKTAAERLIRQGTVYDTPVGTYDDFCARFPYVETEDQARAITEVFEDLHSGKPMDRLVCGDVGFGKTEVALRAAFVVAMSDTSPLPEGGRVREGVSQITSEAPLPNPPPHSGRGNAQVAIICPTTLLARQHFRNFRERFSGFPITVRQLSRMVPTREQKDTREQLMEGNVDIVVGTHALLSKQVEFKNLGLVIVDEEQHFGVVQKEKLKEMRANVHMLTLSATPIPRTLQMALTGVRELSLITTPPVDRLAVRSFVMPFDPVVVKEAILREMHRGGKCFAVTPRIKDIAEFKAQLLELIPEARICVAHGQMPPSDLDEIMNNFYDGKYDILLSTAIIESGLDIPTANTMIIHNAHLFGLSQLYQMRGRVGRGKIRAYAYFLLPHRRQLTRNATRRLEVMQTLDTLGAGFTLASHDMDIRGFGNLVGEEQSGHIREVGIELYQQMLEDAVAALKVASQQSSAASENTKDARRETNDWSPQINLGISVLITEDYVSDLQLRLGLYRRVACMLEEADINSFAAELTDRFGEMPGEVRHLIAVLGIKILCRNANIDRLDVGPKGAVITFRDNVFAKPDALLAYVDRNPRTLKVRPDQKLVYNHEWKEVTDKIAAIRKLVGEIVTLAK